MIISMNGRKQKLSLMGSITASILASSCCIGPMVFALLGVSSAGVISKVEPYRGIILFITIVLLISAFYYTYKKKTFEQCRVGSYCANPKSDSWNKIILWVSTVTIVIFLTFPYWSIYLV